MSELQSEESPVLEESNLIETEVEETQTQETGSELAPDSEEEHDKKHEGSESSLTDEAQESVNKRIAKLTFEKKQAERELEAFRNQQANAVSNEAPEVMPIPDPFDDDYEEKIAQRDEQLLAKARWDAQQNVFQQQQQQQAQVQLESATKSYAQKAQELGIKQDELASAANNIAMAGLSNDVVIGILSDPEGPMIAKALGNDYESLSKLPNMTAWEQANYLNSVVREKARALQPKQTNAPAPAKTIKGGGDVKVDKHTKLIGKGTFS